MHSVLFCFPLSFMFWFPEFSVYQSPIPKPTAWIVWIFSTCQNTLADLSTSSFSWRCTWWNPHAWSGLGWPHPQSEAQTPVLDAPPPSSWGIPSPGGDSPGCTPLSWKSGFSLSHFTLLFQSSVLRQDTWEMNVFEMLHVHKYLHSASRLDW